jgi:hypothetical protein
MARSMLPYRRERKLVSQPPTPDGSMAVIKVNLVTSAAFHNDGRARGSSKVTSHSKWVDTGLHCPWHRFPHISANHDNSPAASTESAPGTCGPERIALINPYGAAWSIQRPGCTGLGVGATPLAHTRARARLAIAANIAKLPELLAKGGSSGESLSPYQRQSRQLTSGLH